MTSSLISSPRENKLLWWSHRKQQDFENWGLELFQAWAETSICFCQTWTAFHRLSCWFHENKPRFQTPIYFELKLFAFDWMRQVWAYFKIKAVPIQPWKKKKITLDCPPLASVHRMMFSVVFILRNGSSWLQHCSALINKMLVCCWV